MNTSPSPGPSYQVESFADGLTVRIDERGSGRPILLLHGGGGPQTVSGLAEALSTHAHVLTPIHPGFGGQPRPEWFDSIDDLALTYLDLLERLDLRDVMVIGSSIGGWIAAELAVRNTTRLSTIVLIDAVGIQVEWHPIADVFPLTPDELSTLSFHNPAPFRIDPTTLSPEQRAVMAENFQALAVYGRKQGMSDPKLRRRLGRVSIPALVIWGESDGVVDPDYGRAYAQALPNARFELISEAGHLPHIEQPERLLTLVQEFADSITAKPPVARSFKEH
ncbi:MAG: alpha/beta hydrolase [Chloroflexota bacterium]|nr:alpha/beta hydrolase [Chloroflexota bacterium]